MMYLIDAKTGEILFECAKRKARAMTKAIMRHGDISNLIVNYDGWVSFPAETWLEG